MHAYRVIETYGVHAEDGALEIRNRFYGAMNIPHAELIIASECAGQPRGREFQQFEIDALKLDVGIQLAAWLHAWWYDTYDETPSQPLYVGYHPFNPYRRQRCVDEHAAAAPACIERDLRLSSPKRLRGITQVLLDVVEIEGLVGMYFVPTLCRSERSVAIDLGSPLGWAAWINAWASDAGDKNHLRRALNEGKVNPVVDRRAA